MKTAEISYLKEGKDKIIITSIKYFCSLAQIKSENPKEVYDQYISGTHLYKKTRHTIAVTDKEETYFLHVGTITSTKHFEHCIALMKEAGQRLTSIRNMANRLKHVITIKI